MSKIVFLCLAIAIVCVSCTDDKQKSKKSFLKKPFSGLAARIGIGKSVRDLENNSNPNEVAAALDADRADSDNDNTEDPPITSNEDAGKSSSNPPTDNNTGIVDKKSSGVGSKLNAPKDAIKVDTIVHRSSLKNMGSPKINKRVSFADVLTENPKPVIHEKLPRKLIDRVLDHLSIESLSSAIASNHHLTNIKMFREKFLAALEEYKVAAEKNPKEANISQVSKAIVKACTPDGDKGSEAVDAAKFAFLWKLMALVKISKQDEELPYVFDMFQSTMFVYIQEKIGFMSDVNIRAFSAIIKVVDFNNISRYLYILINEMQYESAPLIAGFILLVENSPHMKNQFDDAMMLNVNNFQYYLNGVLTRSDESVNKFYSEARFTLNGELRKGEITNDILASYHVRELSSRAKNINRRYTIEGTRTSKYLFRAYYYGVKQLAALGKEQIDELYRKIKFNLAPFELVARKDPIVKLMYEDLKELMKNSPIMKTSLSEQVKDLQLFMGLANSVFNDTCYSELLNSYPARFVPEMERSVYVRVKSLFGSDSLKNLNGYIKALEIFQNLGTITYRNAFRLLYFAYYSLVSNPKMFNHMKELRQIDAIHDVLFNIKLNDLKAIKDDKLKFPTLLDSLFKNFKSMMTITITQNKEMREKQMILLKCAVALGNEVYGTDFVSLIQRVPRIKYKSDAKSRQQIFDIIKFFYGLTKFYGEEISRSTCLMNEWILFNDFLPDEIITLYTRSDDPVFKLIRYPIAVQSSAFNTATYLSQLLMIRHLGATAKIESSNERSKPNLTDTAIENILNMEKYGYPKTVDQKLKTYIFLQTRALYSLHSSQIRDKQEKQLIMYLDKSLDYILHLNHVTSHHSVEPIVLQSILQAVNKYEDLTKSDLKTNNRDLVTKIDQVAFNAKLEHPEQFSTYLEPLYMECKKKFDKYMYDTVTY